MKRLALVLLSVITLSSCSIDDDGYNIVTNYAEVSANDLPGYFEKGKTYEVEVDYLLPNLCHQGVGLQVNREAQAGEKRRNIYIAGLASFDTEKGECTLEPNEDSDLIETAKFTITIEEEEPYTFNFWVGVDMDGESIFETVVVPVGAPDVEETE